MMAEQKEPIIISVSDPGGIERDYVQDVVIPFAGKEFAVLVSIPEDGGECRGAGNYPGTS